MNGMWGNGPNTGVNNNGMNFGWSLPSPPQNSTGSFMAVIVNGGEAREVANARNGNDAFGS